jgi:hypothetical protein
VCIEKHGKFVKEIGRKMKVKGKTEVKSRVVEPELGPNLVGTVLICGLWNQNCLPNTVPGTRK